MAFQNDSRILNSRILSFVRACCCLSHSFLAMDSVRPNKPWKNVDLFASKIKLVLIKLYRLFVIYTKSYFNILSFAELCLVNAQLFTHWTVLFVSFSDIHWCHWHTKLKASDETTEIQQQERQHQPTAVKCLSAPKIIIIRGARKNWAMNTNLISTLLFCNKITYTLIDAMN